MDFNIGKLISYELDLYFNGVGKFKWIEVFFLIMMESTCVLGGFGFDLSYVLCLRYEYDKIKCFYKFFLSFGYKLNFF